MKLQPDRPDVLTLAQRPAKFCADKATTPMPEVLDCCAMPCAPGTN